MPVQLWDHQVFLTRLQQTVDRFIKLEVARSAVSLHKVIATVVINRSMLLCSRAPRVGLATFQTLQTKLEVNNLYGIYWRIER